MIETVYSTRHLVKHRTYNKTPPPTAGVFLVEKERVANRDRFALYGTKRSRMGVGLGQRDRERNSVNVFCLAPYGTKRSRTRAFKISILTP